MITPKVKSLKSYKTPLRYPGGKSRALSKLFQFIPDLSQYKEYREPFLGGGSVAIEIGKRYPHLNIWVNDLYEPLYNFWSELQHNGDQLYQELFDLKTVYCNPDAARCLFQSMKDSGINDKEKTNLERAVAFYVVNKCSFSGLTESSSFSAQASDSNFSMRGIEKLPEYSELISNWHINQYSYEYLMRENVHDGIFMYLDPPYEIKIPIYGKRGAMHKYFDHDKFADDCNNSKIHMLISYNSSQIIKDRFKNWSVGEFDLTYSMRTTGDYMKNQKDRKELMLFNYGT